MYIHEKMYINNIGFVCSSYAYIRFVISLICICFLVLNQLSISEPQSTDAEKATTRLKEILTRGSEDAESLGMLRKLLENGADPNTRGKKGLTSLMLFAYENDYRGIDLALSRNANPALKDNNGLSALEYTCVPYGKEFTRKMVIPPALRRAYPDPDARQSVILGEIAAINKLVTPQTVNKLDEIGFTPLIWAIFAQNYESVSTLLEIGADVHAFDIPNIPNEGEENFDRGNSPLHYALERKERKIVKQLIDHGAKVNGETKEFSSPLLAAVNYNQYENVQELIAHGVDVHKEFAGQSEMALWFAVEDNFERIAELLIENGSDIKSTGKDDKTSLLSVASGQGHPKLVSLLLNKHADPNVQNEMGETPLIAALGFPNPEIRFKIVSILLAAGANPLKRTLSGRDAIDVAKKLHDPKLLKLIVHPLKK